jgi:hypothetical protein
MSAEVRGPGGRAVVGHRRGHRDDVLRRHARDLHRRGRHDAVLEAARRLLGVALRRARGQPTGRRQRHDRRAGHRRGRAAHGRAPTGPACCSPSTPPPATATASSSRGPSAWARSSCRGQVEPDTYVCPRTGDRVARCGRGHQTHRLVAATDGHDHRGRARRRRGRRPGAGRRRGPELAGWPAGRGRTTAQPQDMEWAIAHGARCSSCSPDRSPPCGPGAAARPRTAVDDRPTGEGARGGAWGPRPGKVAGACGSCLAGRGCRTSSAGEVLVAPMTNPDWVPTMRRAAAVVTDGGGMTCHAAIVSRELGMPCVVGTRTPPPAAGRRRGHRRRRPGEGRGGRRRRHGRCTGARAIAAGGPAGEAAGHQAST